MCWAKVGSCACGAAATIARLSGVVTTIAATASARLGTGFFDEVFLVGPEVDDSDSVIEVDVAREHAGRTALAVVVIMALHLCEGLEAIRVKPLQGVLVDVSLAGLDGKLDFLFELEQEADGLAVNGDEVDAGLDTSLDVRVEETASNDLKISQLGRFILWEDLTCPCGVCGDGARLSLGENFVLSLFVENAKRADAPVRRRDEHAKCAGAP